MPLPTAQDVLADSQLDFAGLGLDETRVQRLVDAAVALISRWTGQRWNAGGVWSNLPPAGGLEPLAREAVRQFTEFFALRTSADIAETAADFDQISAFSAGSYSETRRGGADTEAAYRAMISNLLRPLMTLDALDEWLVLEDPNRVIPSFAVTEVDWSGRGSLNEALSWSVGLPPDPWPPVTD